jgi:hypothetical protein
MNGFGLDGASPMFWKFQSCGLQNIRLTNTTISICGRSYCTSSCCRWAPMLWAGQLTNGKWGRKKVKEDSTWKKYGTTILFSLSRCSIRIHVCDGRRRFLLNKQNLRREQSSKERLDAKYTQFYQRHHYAAVPVHFSKGSSNVNFSWG